MTASPVRDPEHLILSTAMEIHQLKDYLLMISKSSPAASWYLCGHPFSEKMIRRIPFLDFDKATNGPAQHIANQHSKYNYVCPL